MDSEVKYLLEEERVNNLPCVNTRSTFDAVVEHPLDFLEKRPFSSWWDVMQDGDRIPLRTREEYNITDAEELVFWLMIGEYSFYFRDDKGAECRRQMINIWERLLSKAPSCTSSVVLRRLKEHDRTDFKIGEIWECPFSLTCTTNTESDWSLRDNESIYEIHLLKNGKTKAKNVYEIYNHGIECDSPEYQVNFPKGVTFKIDGIEDMVNGRKKIIMQEI